VDVATDSLIVEITGTPDKIDAMIELLEEFGILELGRTGLLAMRRGPIRPRSPQNPPLKTNGYHTSSKS
jgi:acetolactate synthase-1/3 small subunit